MRSRTPKNRTDREVAKAIALQLPDVELNSHHGTMDIRVRNKLFARFRAQSKVLELMGADGSWQQVALEEIDRETLRTLLIDAWAATAPPQLRTRHEAELRARVR